MDGEGGQDCLDKDTVLMVGGRQRLGGSRRLESRQGRVVCHSGVHAVHPQDGGVSSTVTGWAVKSALPDFTAIWKR